MHFCGLLDWYCRTNSSSAASYLCHFNSLTQDTASLSYTALSSPTPEARSWCCGLLQTLLLSLSPGLGRAGKRFGSFRGICLASTHCEATRIQELGLCDQMSLSLLSFIWSGILSRVPRGLPEGRGLCPKPDAGDQIAVDIVDYCKEGIPSRSRLDS